MRDCQAEPNQIVAGDSCTWTRFLSDFLPGDGWALSYVLVSQGKDPITIGTTAQDGGHRVDLGTADTQGWAPGSYRWTALATKDGQRRTLGGGTVEVLPDPTTLDAAYDPRSHAEKCLVAVEAALEGRIGDPLLEWEIAGRKVKEYPLDQLRQLRRELQEEIRIHRTGSPFVIIPTNLRRDLWPNGGSGFHG